MRLLLYGLNFAPEPTGVGKFTGEMAAWLKGRGHEVEAVAAPPYYPAWRVDPAYRPYRLEEWQGVRVRRAPLYVPSRPRGPHRVIHLASFAASSLPLAWWRAVTFHPQVVIAVAPTLLALPGALAAARLAHAPAWLHIQDFETDAAFSLGLLGGDAPRRAALGAERWLLGRCERVSTISEPMRRRLVDKGVPETRVRLLPNWADTAAIRPGAGPSPLRAEFGIPESAVVALYAGTLGHKQGLEILETAARRLADAPDILLLAAGAGPGRAGLEAAAARQGNLRLLPLQPVERLGELLALADLHLLPERPQAADLVMPSKLGGMLASGRPVIAAVRAEGAVAAAVAGCGVVVPPGDGEALAAAIRTLAGAPERRAALGRAARERALGEWDRDTILTRFEAELAELIRS